MKKKIALLTVSLALYGWSANAQTPSSGYQVVGSNLIGASELQPGVKRTESKLSFKSSEASLVEGFNWAKQQSMSFAFENDPVGPWYEAAEPGREDFCMLGVANEAMGAHALGLEKHNLNMLRRIAENISEARDWCSLWEINRYNLPAPVAYKNDAEFWYNLPANFEIIDLCYRMYVWTGDRTYVDDPVFLNFYDRTVTDYVERWGLGIEQIMKRPRLLNIRGMVDPHKRFQSNRGIPGYNEGDSDFVLGVDVLATQYVAYKAYSFIQGEHGKKDLAEIYEKKAGEVRKLVNNTWWNGEEQYFYGILNKDHKFAGRLGSWLLYRDIVDDGPKMQSAMKESESELLRSTSENSSSDYTCEVMYKYGNPDVATKRMIEIGRGIKTRREYPEVPFSWIGTLVNGTMGITIDASSPLKAWVEGFWVETIVRTLPGLGNSISWAELNNLPIRSNEVTVRHEGIRKTLFINQSGPALIWCAVFPGSHNILNVNGKSVKANIEDGTLGRKNSWVRVTVGSGGTTTVEVPK
jgi:hypothetical protein